MVSERSALGGQMHSSAIREVIFPRPLAPARIVENPQAAPRSPVGIIKTMKRFGRRLTLTLEMIKFQHSIFALPFALLGAVLAAEGAPTAWEIAWILAACLFARSAAMSFNRLHDEPFDRANPRTQGWALPSGLLRRSFVWKFCVLCIAGFVVSAGMLNWTALALSPVALAVLLGYSYTKRFTSGSHFFLGLALGIAPVGAWVAVRAELALAPVLLGAAVALWAAGFDIIYSLQDFESDRRQGLHSLPVRLGKRRALAVSVLCHALAIIGFLLVVPMTSLGNFYLLTLAGCAWLLLYEQTLVSAEDLSRVGQAFFAINGWISVLVFIGGAADVFTNLP